MVKLSDVFSSHVRSQSYFDLILSANKKVKTADKNETTPIRTIIQRSIVGAYPSMIPGAGDETL